MAEGDVMNVQAATEYFVSRGLTVCRKTVQRWIKEGRLPRVDIPSRRLFVRRADLDRLVEGKGAKDAN